jgi:uncharacterized protein (DUF1015 family)
MHAEPISCWRPVPTRAAEFAAPPYDVFDRSSARSYVSAHPNSFLAIDRPETAFSPEHDMYAPDVYAKARELLNDRVADGTLLHDEEACYYVWRMANSDHVQTGLVCGAAVDDYEDGTIRRHEQTRAAKQADRIEHIRATRAQTGPIFLTYRDESAIDTLISLATAASPLYDFIDGDGCHHSIWRIARSGAVDSLRLMFDRIPAAYIADGHHRAASAVAVCEQMRSQARNEGGAPATDASGFVASDLFLAVLFPASQLKILPYNRVLRGLDDISVSEVLANLEEKGFSIKEAPGIVEPAERGVFGMKLDGLWYELRFMRSSDETKDPVGALDVSVAQHDILGPLFSVEDPTRDPRISFVGGEKAAERAGKLAGESGMALTLHATSLDELMSVSDAGLLMPPKSTWFEPKLLSGLFIRHI